MSLIECIYLIAELAQYWLQQLERLGEWLRWRDGEVWSVLRGKHFALITVGWSSSISPVSL